MNVRVTPAPSNNLLRFWLLWSGDEHEGAICALVQGPHDHPRLRAVGPATFACDLAFLPRQTRPYRIPDPRPPDPRDATMMFATEDAAISWMDARKQELEAAGWTDSGYNLLRDD